MTARDGLQDLIDDTAIRSQYPTVGVANPREIAAAIRKQFGVVELPEEHFAGDYALVHIDCDEIYIDVSCLDNTDDARTIAAALLRAADQLDKQRAEERGPDGGELDWGARADDARDALVDSENGVTP